MVHRLTSFRIGASILSPSSGDHSVNSSTSRRTYRQPTIPRPTARPNESTKSSSNIFASLLTTSRTTGSTCYPSQSLPTTILSIWLPVLLRFSQPRVSTHDLKYLSIQFLLKVLTRWHPILRNCTSTSTNSFSVRLNSTNVTPRAVAYQFPISRSVT